MKRATWGVALAALLSLASASAHIVYGTRTLRAFVQEADLVVRAEIVSTEPVALSTQEGELTRPAVEARVLEVLKGDSPGERVRFVQHGHGVAPFAVGDESLLFLLRIERNRELAVLGRVGAVAWVSLQEHDDRYPLRPGSREALLTAARAYAAAPSGAAPLRTATLALLESGESDLAASAIRDWVGAPDAPWVDAEDVPRLRKVLDGSELSVGVRAGLLRELERRGWVDAGPYWSAWLSDDVAPRDRITAIRASAAAPTPALRARWVALRAGKDDEVAAAAAAALGSAGAEDSVASLAQALEHDSARVRGAAIRALGRVGTDPARQALEAAADAHADPDTRRRARGELGKRRGDS